MSQSNPPQETGIDILERYFRKYTATPKGVNLSEIDEAFEKSKVNAAQALLQLFEKEAEIVEFPYEVHGEYERKAITLSKLRELLGGDI